MGKKRKKRRSDEDSSSEEQKRKCPEAEEEEWPSIQGGNYPKSDSLVSKYHKDFKSADLGQ